MPRRAFKATLVMPATQLALKSLATEAVKSGAAWLERGKFMHP
jgi:hypothetical protein